MAQELLKDRYLLFKGTVMKKITMLSLAISLLFVITRVQSHKSVAARNSIKQYVKQQQLEVIKTYRKRSV
jgi:hypothetical protein